jgi:RecJ-like exonuclease
MARRGSGSGFPKVAVEELSKMKRPHEIEGVPDCAVDQLSAAVRLEKEVRKEGKKMGRLAYAVTTQHSTGNVAKLLIGAFGVPVGVASSEQEKGWYEVSLRGTSECKVHLGRVASRISSKLGGNGGGHRKAAGCRIPVDKMNALLLELKRRV